MREMLFRGKRIDNGEWVEGWLVLDVIVPRGQTYVLDESYIDGLKGETVHPTTIGQYTELKDKNGKRIFEGDIVRIHDCLLRCDAPYHEFDGVVGYRDASFVVITNSMTHYRWLDYDVTVIGNIHDNHELLEVNHDER